MYKRMPITEIGDVGMTFAESEVRHKDAYARLLRILGLEQEFHTVIEIPATNDRDWETFIHVSPKGLDLYFYLSNG
jgi:ribonucleoside-diphosphate reductase beta chain